MRFYVIYSFDIPRSESVKSLQPPKHRKWELTEGDESYEFDYVADECGDESYRNGKHRKYCAELSKEEFDDFVDHCGLYPEDIETMGSLTGLGWMPAISFNDYDDPNVITKNAYVTPLLESPQCKQGRALDEDVWQRVRRAVIDYYELR